MNHGKCEKCGWWTKKTATKGSCNISSLYNDFLIVTNFDDYCTDYINRKKFKSLTQ